MTLNFNATPIGLYDIVSPDAPNHLTVRNAIETHRDGNRPPVALSLERAYAPTPDENIN